MVLFTNGYFTLESDAEPVFDSNGNLVVAPIKDEATVPCQIDGVPQLVAIREGNAETLTANIYVNYSDMDNTELFNPKSIHLYHNKRGDLGVFVVKALSYYDLTQAYVLTI